MRRHLPSVEELLRMMVPNQEEVQSADGDELERRIVLIDEGVRKTLFSRHEAFLDVQNSLMSIRLCIDWYESTLQDLPAVRRNLLLYTCVNMFYSFWNLVGRVLNDLLELGNDYEKSGPTMHKVLSKCRKEHPLLGKSRLAFDSEIQKRIADLRHRYAHRRGPRYGLHEIIDVYNVAGKPERVEKPAPDTNTDEVLEWLRQGFMELFDFYLEFAREFDEENRALADGTSTEEGE